MKVLMFSGDPSISEAGSPAWKRTDEYAKALEKLEVIKFDRREGRFMRFWKGYKDAKEILSKEKFDLITAQEIEHSFIAWRLSKKFDIPWQMQIHTDIFSPYFVRYRMSNRARVWLAKFLIPRASGIRVVSERIKKSIHDSGFRIHGSRLVVLPIFTEHDIPVKHPMFDIKGKYPGYDFYILMVSRLAHEKNIKLGLDVLREFIKKYPETLLVVVGDGPLKNVLIDDVKIGLEGKVVFEGWKPTEELADYYKSADLLLITSNYEGYSLAAMEALKSGLPVIMTNVGVAGEVVKDGENGLVAPVGDNTALVGKLTEFRESKALRDSLKANAKITPMPYNSFDEYRDKLIDSFKACIQGKLK